MMTNPVINRSGTKRWFSSDGKLHRDDGPALELANGTKSWWINGQLHREDGPAYEYAVGLKYWFIKGINITNEANQWIKDNNFPDYKEWDDNIKIFFKLKFG